MFISPGMRLGVYMARDWLFFNLLPTDSCVMCDHFSNVAGQLLFLPLKTDFRETSCVVSFLLSQDYAP